MHPPRALGLPQRCGQAPMADSLDAVHPRRVADPLTAGVSIGPASGACAGAGDRFSRSQPCGSAPTSSPTHCA